MPEDTPEASVVEAAKFPTEKDKIAIKITTDCLAAELLNESNNVSNQKKHDLMYSIRNRGNRIFPDHDLEGMQVWYQTSTGEIMLPEGDFQAGEFSYVSLHLIKPKLGSYKAAFELISPHGQATITQLNQAIMANSQSVDSTEPTLQPTIFPQRYFPGDDLNQVGLAEVWGQSELVRDTHGDLIILAALREFNHRYGPKS